MRSFVHAARSPYVRSRAKAAVHARRSGMTLIEILIVIALLALVSIGITFGVGALHRTKLRSSALDIVAAARFGYHRAVTHGKTVRTAFDLDAHTIAVEEAHGEITLDRSDQRDSDDEEDRSAVDPWEAARARLEDAYGANLGRAGFSVIGGSDGQPRQRYMPHQLPVTESRDVARARESGDDSAALAADANVLITRLITPHEQEIRESGKGYIYFFPGGRAEHAVVQITDADREHVYSVEVHPLTGRAQVYSYAYEPREMMDEEASEVRDPG